MPVTRRVHAIALCLVVTAFTCSLGCSSDKALEAGVKIKRGAKLRVIDLDGPGGEATANNKPIPVFPIDKGIGWFSLMPPKETTIAFGDESVALKLESDKEYTVVLLEQGKAMTFVCADTKTMGGPTALIFNATSKQLKIENPSDVGTLSPGQASGSFAFSGKVEASNCIVERQETKPDGIYAVVFSQEGAKLIGNVLWTNPPMDVVGATQGR